MTKYKGRGSLRFQRTIRGPRGSGRTHKILEQVIAKAKKGSNILFVHTGARSCYWDMCQRIEQPKRAIHNMRKLLYGEGWIIFTTQIRREMIIGSNSEVVLDHTLEWVE